MRAKLAVKVQNVNNLGLELSMVKSDMEEYKSCLFIKDEIIGDFRMKADEAAHKLDKAKAKMLKLCEELSESF